MRDLFYKDGDKPLFETGGAVKNKEDAHEMQRKMAKWKNAFRTALCSTKEGREVLWLLIHETYVYRPYDQHNAGAYALEGKRELGLFILNMVGHDEALKTLMAVKAEAEKGDDE